MATGMHSYSFRSLNKGFSYQLSMMQPLGVTVASSAVQGLLCIYWWNSADSRYVSRIAPLLPVLANSPAGNLSQRLNPALYSACLYSVYCSTGTCFFLLKIIVLLLVFVCIMCMTNMVSPRCPDACKWLPNVAFDFKQIPVLGVI